MILTLDLSSKVGWAAGNPGGRPTGGVKLLPPIINPGRMFNAYGDWLCDILSGDANELGGVAPTLVVTEAPMELAAMARCNTPNLVMYQQVGLAAVTDYLCDRYDVECRSVPVLTARQKILGRARGWDKEGGEILRELESRGFDGLVDHNHADAVLVWLYACAVRAELVAAA